MSADKDEKGSLPVGPATLNFNKDEFMKDTFSVDRFICEYRKQVSLESLRDDLNVYLQILKNAMIELINKDYADFVNLSANLVGLDKVINNLMIPIGQLKEEVMHVKIELDEAINAMNEKLVRRQEIREKKAFLEHLMSITLCIDKIEQFLNVQIEDKDEKGNIIKDKSVKSDLIERVASEFNALHFHLNKTKGHPYAENVKARISYATRVLQQNLEETFLISLDNNDVEQLSRCLRIYSAIDKTHEAEDIFRRHKVVPFMEKIMPENVENGSVENLQFIYSEVLKFIPKYCTVLKLAAKGSQSSEIIEDYDFIVNAIWPEFVLRIEIRMRQILTPIIPDSFHEKFMATLRFLEQFEQLCGSQLSVKKFREHSLYAQFMNKWNLPIYFQIRFQEIAGKLETSFISQWEETMNDSKEFLLVPSQVLWECLNMCWSETIYIPQLCHRFWKLTLQLLSRYCEWLKNLLPAESKTTTSKEDSPDINETSGEAAKGFRNGMSVQIEKPTILKIVLVIQDVKILIGKLLPFCKNTVEPALKNLSIDSFEFLEEILMEFSDALMNQLPTLEKFITTQIGNQCEVHLKLVTDLPRLYRRTNREVPNKPSAYLSSALQPLEKFNEECQIIPEDTRKKWISIILNNVSQQYYNMILNVLTSVKKMEESLNRLKKVREKGNSNTGGLPGGMSDDDKIRLQLLLDIEEYGKKIESMGLESSEITCFASLVELVESARTSPNRSTQQNN